MPHSANTAAGILIQPRIMMAAGGAGIDVALTREATFHERIAQVLGADGEQQYELKGLLFKLAGECFADSDRREDMVFDARFALRPAQTLVTPSSYRPLLSPSGRTIRERVHTPPFQHLQGWPGLNEIDGKSSDSEAEGCRLYGAVNGLVSVRPLYDQIRRALAKTRDVVGSEGWLRLAEIGLTLDDGIRIDLFSSIAGGQGSGLIVTLLALLASQIADYRERVKVNLHLLLPGFHPAQNEAEKAEQYMKALAVLRDLAALKIAGRPLAIPFHNEDIQIESRHSKELFNYLFVYQPSSAESDRYKAFVTRVAHTIVSGELSAVSANLRRARSNANNLAYRFHHLSLVGGMR